MRGAGDAQILAKTNVIRILAMKYKPTLTQMCGTQRSGLSAYLLRPEIEYNKDCDDFFPNKCYQTGSSGYLAKTPTDFSVNRHNKMSEIWGR